VFDAQVAALRSNARSPRRGEGGQRFCNWIVPPAVQKNCVSDDDLRVYRPGGDRPNTHWRFAHLAVQSWMGIRASPDHWHHLPDAAGYDVDRTRTWDWGFLAINKSRLLQLGLSGKKVTREGHCRDTHRSSYVEDSECSTNRRTTSPGSAAKWQ
jgi:hypothetical protein